MRSDGRSCARPRWGRAVALCAAIGAGAGLSGNALFTTTTGSLHAPALLGWIAVWSAAVGAVLGAYVPSFWPRRECHEQYMSAAHPAAVLARRDTRRASAGTGIVATFGSYTDARQAADHLARRGFPAGRLAIVGADLRVVQRIVGRWTWWHAIATGAFAGAVGGLLLGALLAGATASVLGTVDVLAWTAAWGAVIGAGLASFIHASSGRRRCICARARLVPHEFELHADVDLVEDARTLLSGPRSLMSLPGLR
jgi:hypothetical protein